MLFELKYEREGKAEYYWKIGIAMRAGNNAKTYPKDAKSLFPDLYEKQPTASIPDWLKDDYEKKINQQIVRR